MKHYSLKSYLYTYIHKNVFIILLVVIFVCIVEYSLGRCQNYLCLACYIHGGAEKPWSIKESQPTSPKIWMFGHLFQFWEYGLGHKIFSFHLSSVGIWKMNEVWKIAALSSYIYTYKHECILLIGFHYS